MGTIWPAKPKIFSLALYRKSMPIPSIEPEGRKKTILAKPEIQVSRLYLSSHFNHIFSFASYSYPVK